jgi:hypothetical protein
MTVAEAVVAMLELWAEWTRETHPDDAANPYCKLVEKTGLTQEELKEA